MQEHAVNTKGTGSTRMAAPGVQEHAINTKGAGSGNRMATPGADTTADPKHPRAMLKTRTKSNQSNE